jgi:urease accessory protein
MLRAIDHRHAGHLGGTPFDTVTLAHDARHLRRRRLALTGGEDILVDLPEAIALGHGDALLLEDGRLVGIAAAEEDLLEVTGRNRDHLMRLCWHLGNRHLPAQIESDRVLIQRDHVIANMLKGLGATVRDLHEPFHPERGAYHSHGHSHGHDHNHHDHDHAHG